MNNTFFIEILVTGGKSWRVPLPPEALIVGRSPKRCGLLLPDTRVSRIHLRVFRSPDRGVTITDMYSANGTTLDGRSLPPGLALTWLIDQRVVVGSTTLTLHYGDLD